MNEQDEKELIDIVFDNPNRVGNREIKIVPPDGIKSMMLSYCFKWNNWFLRVGRQENRNGFFFTMYYDIVDEGNKYIAYIGNENHDAETYCFRDKSEIEMLKIALAFTTEELNKLADEAID